MSRNNQLVIIEKEDGFYIHENFCVDNPFRATKKNLISKYATLREAIIRAQACCDNWPVEYGYRIILKENK